MIGKKINQLATELAPVSTDLTIIGDPTTGVSKKITLAQLGAIFSGAVSFYTNYAAFPTPGTTDVIFCAKDTKKLYLWSGSAYVEVFPSQALLDTYQLRSEKGVSNGYASLDSSGKVPISQLPSSIMEYKGTWSAATNTPTLANGTGDTGDVYLCNAAGTVNFGAGAIAFAVGDYVVYSGSIWQRSSGAVGTVTSVAATITGNAIGITGSPVTTSGTLAFAFGGNSTQYINGAGNLVTFPGIINEAQNLITEVYNKTGATLTKGTVVYINGGQGNLPSVTKALATGDSTSAQTYGIVRNDITNNNNGYVVVAGRISDLDTQAYTEGTQLYLSPTTAGTYTSTKPYAPNHLVYVGIVVRAHPTQGVIEVKIQNGYELDELHNVAAQNPDNNDILQYKTSTSLWTKVAGTTSNIAEGSNLYYTDARSRAALSFTAGSGAYNSTTGVITIPTNTNQLTNGAAFITLGSLSASSPLSYNSGTGAFSISQANSTTNGFLSSTDWNTFNSKQSALTFSSPLVNTAGTISIPAASGSVNGYLSSTDWTTFNSKQNALNGTGFVKISGTTISYDNSTYYLASNPNAYIALTNLSAGAGISYNNTTGVIASTITQYTDAMARAAFSETVAGLDYNSTTGVLSLTSGYVIPTTTNETNWNAAYNDKINSAAVTGTTTKTLTLTQQDGGTITASWTDDNTDAVTSVFGRTGAVVAVSGDYTTSLVTEGTNLYFTNARARAAISAGTGISYNSTTGVITNTITQYTDALARAAISLTTTGTSGAATYNSTTGVLNVPQYAPDLSGYVPTSRTLTINGTSFDLSANRSWSVGTVTSVGLSSATSGVTIGSTPITTSGTITLAIATASGSQQGLLSSTDWTTFNNKQSALTNPVTGTGTTNYLPKFTGTSTIGNSLVIDQGSYVESTANMLISNASTYRGLSITTTTASARPTLSFVNSNYAQYGSYIQDINGRLAFGRMNYDFGGHSEFMTLNASGNLGLGVTPSAWTNQGPAIQIGAQGAIAAIQYASNNNQVSIANNAFVKQDTAFYYIASNPAGLMRIVNSGSFHWMIAPSGSSGAEITWTRAMTLESTGNLLINTVTDAGYKLDVNGTGRFTGNVLISKSTDASVEVNSTSNLSYSAFYHSENGTPKAYWEYINSNFSTTSRRNYLEAYNLVGGFAIYTANAKALDIASTGAATFSSSVTTSGGGFVANMGSTNTEGLIIQRANTSSNAIIKFRTGSSDTWILGNRNTGDETFRLYNYNLGTDVITISNSGAATFSSTIQTAAPTNGTAQPWRLGNAVSGGVTTNSYLIVSVNGTTYSIPALNGLP